MLKCDFNKVAKQSNFIEITLGYGCSPGILLHIFRTPFLKNNSGWLLLNFNHFSYETAGSSQCSNNAIVLSLSDKKHGDVVA